MDRHIAQSRLPAHAHLRTEPIRSRKRRPYQSVGSPAAGTEGGVCERKGEAGGRHMQRDGEGAIVVGERKDKLADSLFVVRKQRTLK
jgi:hypothetical protein